MQRNYSIFFLLFLISCSQKPQPNNEIAVQTPQKHAKGIGPFVPGVTTIGIMNQLKRDLNVEHIKTLQSPDYFRQLDPKNGDTLIAEIIPNRNDPDKSIMRAFYCRQARLFYIKNLTITGIPFQGVELTFYNDTLAEFYSLLSDVIEDSMKARYGKGIKEYDKGLYTDWNNPSLVTRTITMDKGCYGCGMRRYELSFLMYDSCIRGRLMDCNLSVLDSLR